MKRFSAFLLSAALLLSPALAAGSEEKFPAVKEYPGYADVQETDWFYDNAKLCYEIGLMNGTDLGFEPGKVLTVAECAALAARLRAALTGEDIPHATPLPGQTRLWYQDYVDYLNYALTSADGFPTVPGLLSRPEEAIDREGFLTLLALAIAQDESLFPTVNSIAGLPDVDGPSGTVLWFYNIGILTGVDKYGTFAGAKSLTRAEAAAMVARVARPELRKTFTPADYSPFTAAYLTPDTVMFDTGLTAEEFLITINNAIAAWETALGDDFNWHYVWTDGKSVLDHVKEDSLSALGVTEKQGTQAYKDFDVQVYYSRLIDLTGETL